MSDQLQKFAAAARNAGDPSAEGNPFFQKRQPSSTSPFRKNADPGSNEASDNAASESPSASRASPSPEQAQARARNSVLIEKAKKIPVLEAAAKLAPLLQADASALNVLPSGQWTLGTERGANAVDLAMIWGKQKFMPAVRQLSDLFSLQATPEEIQALLEQPASALAQKTNPHEQARARLDALAKKVKDIQLVLVMQALGAQPNQDRIRNKWKVDGAGNISVKGQSWFNHNSEKGGRDAIGLVSHALNLKFPQAIEWLAREFGEQVDSADIKASLEDLKIKAKEPFSPPEPDEGHIEYVRHYLRHSRSLPSPLIDALISQRKIYADRKKNCIFISKGIAEIRSSFDGPAAFKGLATGSSRDFGFLVKPDPEKDDHSLAICESAIDSISYRAMNPQSAAISAAGAGRDFPRSVGRTAVENGLALIAAFDADEAGDKATQALFNFFYLRVWLKHHKKLSEEITDPLFDDGDIEFLLSEAPGKPLPPNVLFANGSNPFSDPATPPQILWIVKNNDKTKALGLEPGEHALEVNQKGCDYLRDVIRFRRERPSVGKDWNEALKAKSIAALAP